ncbi:HYR domain-containing protein [Blastococcus sp. PRF04-17]|uniref:HYR domain-containing protein n=1 Tax=Blastococcus sp. PRF04-17 TaxID=2933797 RepID=UPI001FF6E079|nr:HYR domain-containing protein [Blastococcus sp. PRF04-17]UOX99825.1 HYR domain-containing protein [Blastococcus sp. PRF04-17]
MVQRIRAGRQHTEGRPSSRFRRLATLLIAGLTGAGGTLVSAPPAAAEAVAGGGFSVNAGTATASFTAHGSGGAVASGHLGTSTVAPETSTITLGAAVTRINWDTLDLAPEDTLNFVFGTPADVVLLEVNGPSVATVAGQLNGYLGTVGGTRGGNVWISAPGGVAFASTAQVDVGGLLATSGLINGADFFGGDERFTVNDAHTSAAIQVAGGARITGHGSVVALVAQSVITASGAQVGGEPLASDSPEVLYGSAADYTVSFDSSAGAPSLLAFTVPHGDGASTGAGLQLFGTTTAEDVFLASTSATPLSAALAGPVNVNGVPASGDGDLVLAAGTGFARTTPAGRMLPVPVVNGPARDLTLAGLPLPPGDIGAFASGNLTNQGAVTSGDGDALLAALGHLTLGPTSTIDGRTVALSTGGDFVNDGGTAAIDDAVNWVVYAAHPDDIVTGGLDSGHTALWASDLYSSPPDVVTTDRYVFAFQPTVTVTADSHNKVFDDHETTTLTWRTNDYAHPGVPGLFEADTAPVWSGTPTLTSPGSGPTAREGTYPVTMTRGGLTSPLRYGFTLVDGSITVDDDSPPAIGVAVSGPAGSNGWYTGDVAVDWTITEEGSDLTAVDGCTDLVMSTDQVASVTCAAASGGGPATRTVEVKRDAAAPTLTIGGSVSGQPYASGTWTNGDVDVVFTCAAGVSGVDTMPTNDTATTTTSYTETCTDRAGNTSDPATFQVNIDRTPPRIDTITASTSAGGYTAGSWTNVPVTVSWTCADTGGSGISSAPTSEQRTTTGSVTPRCSDNAGNVTEGAPFQVNIDTVAPVLAGVPADRTVATTGTSAVVTWTNPTATDNENTASPVVCGPLSGSVFPVGTTEVTCQSTDAAGNTGSASFTVTVVRQVLGATFDRPVDGPVMNVAKLGRVIPVKASLTVDGAAVVGSSTVPVYLQTSRISCTFTGSEDTVESYAAGGSNSGNLFRWDAGAARWIYNLDTSSLGRGAGSCYRISVFYGGTVVNGNATGGAPAGSFFLQTKK